MTKVYKVGVGCADCAAKIERAIGGIGGVSKVRVNFMTQKMKLTADDEHFEEIVDEAQRLGSRIEPEFVISR